MFGKWMKSLAVIGLLVVAMFAMAPMAEARIGPIGAQYDRQAMIEEAYFAVTGVVGSHPPSPTMVNGKWNYMTYDIPAQNLIINRIGSGNAGWTTPVVNGYVPKGFGKGGQCLFFINLLLYRSEADRTAEKFTSWSQNINSHSAAITADRPKAGDIIFKPSAHIAIVVSRSGNDIAIVESNYGYTEGTSLRFTTIQAITNGGYKVFTNVNYYNS